VGCHAVDQTVPGCAGDILTLLRFVVVLVQFGFAWRFVEHVQRTLHVPRATTRRHDLSWAPTKGGGHEKNSDRIERDSPLREAPEYLHVLADFVRLGLRGTAIAIGSVRMEDQIYHSVSGMEATSEPCDWLSGHGDYLFNLAVGQVRDSHVAEDLVQETFLAAIRARDRFSGRSSDRTWLVGILRHKIYDHLRRVCRERPVHADPATGHANKEALDDSLLWAHEVAAECMEPSRRIELAEFRNALETALGKLPTRIGQVFQLYEVEERPNREVCARLNISENNLWVMLHRARKQLQQELADWWHDVKGRRPKAESRNKSEPEERTDMEHEMRESLMTVHAAESSISLN